jgi:hypothetical protein
MTQRNPGTILAFKAGATVNPNRFVKFSADRTVIQAAAVGDAIIGVSDLGAASTEIVDVVMNGIFPVVYGGTVTRGDLLTSDSTGRAVTAAPAAGVNNSTGGRAMVSGVVGDLGSVSISLGSIQGA